MCANSTWYFGNPSAVSTGKNTFRQVWGSRILEDHWRRSVKQTLEASNNTDLVEDFGLEDSTAVSGISAAFALTSAPLAINNSANLMFSKVPKTDEEVAETLRKIENAYYFLGNIYYFELIEKENAVTTFNTLITRFPETEYKPEVLYQLYLINSELDTTSAEQAKNELFSKYPDSIYSKLILNPAFEEQSSIDNEALIEKYQDAYKAYEMGAYDSAYMML